MTTLFFDLDGTLIDVTKRHLTVYHTVAAKMNIPLVSDQEYLRLKQEHHFPVPDEQKELFRRVYKEESEQKSVLHMDTVIPRVAELLETIHRTFRCVLVTKRYHRQNALSQLDKLSLTSYFAEILTPNPESKASAITKSGFSPKDLVIGDTEEDILTAEKLHLSSVAVTWGVRSKEFLQTFSPTHIVETVDALRGIIENTSKY